MASICNEQFFHQFCLRWLIRFRLFETLQRIRLKGASMTARHGPGPVQVHISSPEKPFRTAVLSLAYLPLTQVRKLLNVSRPANAQMEEFVVADEIHLGSENGTHLGYARQVGKSPALCVLPVANWASVSMRFDWLKAVAARHLSLSLTS